MDLSRWIPALRLLPTYDRSWLRADFVAGITLAAYLLPAGLGDASLACWFRADFRFSVGEASELD